MVSFTSLPTKDIGTREEQTSYVDRQAVRAIVHNKLRTQVALIYIAKGSYYKIPGGGIEADEDHKLALGREILEETGCKVSLESIEALATSQEWRNDLHQISFCYVAELLEDTGKPELTELEVADGLTHTWVDTKTALQKMKEAEPTSELGRYIQQRDLFFMQTFASSQE